MAGRTHFIEGMAYRHMKPGRGSSGGLLGGHGSFDFGNLPDSLGGDFGQVLEFAPTWALAKSLGVAFRSSDTPPFPYMVTLLYPHLEKRHRVQLLNTFFAAFPDVESLPVDRSILKGRRITIRVVDKISVEEFGKIASAAESVEPSIVDKVCLFYARRPSVLTKLDAATRTVLLGSLAQTGSIQMVEDAPSPVGATIEVRSPEEKPTVSRQILVTGHAREALHRHGCQCDLG